MEKCKEKFGVNNHTIDGYVYIFVLTRNGQKAVDFWIEHKKSFIADQAPAANIIAHMIIAYDLIGHPELAIDELSKYMDIADNTKVSKSGIHRFNMACMYAKIKDVKNCIRHLLHAVEQGYINVSFDDTDFDLIRNEELFNIFLNYKEEKILYSYLIKDISTITIYSRSEDTLEISLYDGKKYAYSDMACDSASDLLNEYHNQINIYKNKGFVITEPDFVSIWVPVFDDLFKQINSDTTEPVGEMRVEWDFNLSNKDVACYFERPYYSYTDNGFDIDHYGDLLYIPQQKYHKKIITEAIKLDSFKALSKKETVKIIQSEHDSGDEFVEIINV